MALTKPRAYQIYDIDYKQAVRVVTTSNITLSLGAPNSVDGVNLSVNDRILVTGQSNGVQNGIYYVVTLGTGANGTWARSQDTNTTGELDAGTIVMVTEGTTYADTQWKLTTNDPIVIGTTALTFVLNVQANSISSGTSNVVVNANSNVTVSVAGTSNVLTVTSTGANISGTLNATGNAIVGNISATIGTFTTFTSAQGGNVTGTLIATSANAQFFNQTNGAGYITAAGYLTVTGNITGGNLKTSAITIGSTGAISGVSTLSASGNANVGNLGATTVVATTLTGTLSTAAQTNITSVGTLGSLTVTANVAGGNLTTAGQVVATGNVTGGNLITAGRVFAPNGSLSAPSYGFSNDTDSGMFLTGDGNVAITTNSGIRLLVNDGGANVTGSINVTSAITATGNVTGGNINTAGKVTASGIVSGQELSATNSQVNEGGQINLALPSSGSTLVGNVIVDVYQDKLRFFEGAGTNRGAYIDLTAAAAGVGTNLLAGGGGGTPGGANTYVQFNDGGAFGGNAQFTYNKVTNTLTVGIISSTNNGAGTNFKVGDDAWIGDINAADTIRITGQQNSANAYIVFGDANGTALGRAGSGPLTYGGDFSVTGRTFVASGSAAAPGITFTSDIGQDTGFYSISDGNIGVSTNGSLRVTFNDTGGITATGQITGSQFNGSGAGLTAIPAANVTGTLSVNTTGYAATVSTAAQPNITSVGTLSSLAVTGNTTSGNFIGTLNGSGANVSSLNATNLTSGTVPAERLSGTYTITVSGSATSATTAGTVTTAAQPNITSVGTLSSLSVSGNITSSTGHVGTIYTNSIINTGANATGNIGSSALYFNTAFVKATSAQYADVAEYYAGDNNYEPGTVVIFGGEAEVTQSTLDADNAVAGVVSTNPAYIMNSGIQATYSIPVALTGRVPTRVIGPVRKGNMMVSAENGYARACATPSVGTVIGKAIENFDGDRGIIEVVVGRM